MSFIFLFLIFLTTSNFFLYRFKPVVEEEKLLNQANNGQSTGNFDKLFGSLPDEIQKIIFDKLSNKNLISLGRVSKQI